MSTSQMNEFAMQMMDFSDHAMYAFAKDDFQMLYVNKRAREIFGEELNTRTCYQQIAGRQLPCMDCPFAMLNQGSEIKVQRYLEKWDCTVQVRAKEIKWGNDRPAILCKVSDTEQLFELKQKQEAFSEKLRLSGELYEAVVNQLKTIVFEYNYQKNTSYTSALFKQKFGIETISDINFLKSPETSDLLYDEDVDIYGMLFHNREDDNREVTCRLREVSGKYTWYKISIQLIRNENNEVIRGIGTLKDVDEVTRSHETIRYRAEYDVLTDIPNVNRFYIDSNYMIAGPGEHTYAIVAFDINKFKMINDLFGMSTGDKVLQHVAKVLKEQMPENSLYCRTHSDVFFLCVTYNKRGDIIKLIEKIRKGIYKNDFSFDVNTSFGIYLVKDRSTPINLMCDRASLASRTVKDNAMKFCAFYDEQYRTEIMKNTEIEQDMNRALQDSQFQMYLQPKINLRDSKICGAEVLCRWMHPTKGLIQPNDFIPLFERNGFILKLDQYMWEQACKTMAKWKNEGKKVVPLSVNISRYHIKNNDLVGAWKRLIKKYDIDPCDLTLEITETFFYDSEDLYDVLKELQNLGFCLEVDDFGTGYSSLNLIRNVPVDVIKIDKDFLDQKLSTDKGKIVIGHTIAMAKDLNLGVVAEGVETKEHVEFLKSSSCDIAQGYYFAKPMPLEDFENMLSEES
ncbi:MAG: putative bifunctional diguanylate cyclase/phosphodiesterase [Lachnospiraceae bacterium]